MRAGAVGVMLAFLMMFGGVSALAAGEEAHAVQRLRAGDRSGLCTQDYPDPGQSAAVFLRTVDTIEDDTARVRLILFSAALLRKSLRLPANEGAGEPGEAMEALTGIIIKDRSERARAVAARAVKDMFPPAMLNHFHAGLLKEVQRRNELETLLLYACLPSCDVGAVKSAAAGIARQSESRGFLVDAVTARHGDMQAESRLMSGIRTLHETSSVELGRLVRALGYVSTDGMRVFLAEGLRSEETVLLAGGGTVPKRNCYARALVRMHRHTAGFPVAKQAFLYTDGELWGMEAWCAENLGVRVPKRPWRALRVQPGLAP